MPRGQSYATEPDRGLEVPGVGFRERGEVYVLNASLATPDRRECFGGVRDKTGGPAGVASRDARRVTSALPRLRAALAAHVKGTLERVA